MAGEPAPTEQPHAADPSSPADDLFRRLESLETANRFWKRTALGAIAVAALLSVLGVLGVIGAYSVCYSAVNRAAEAERQAEEQMGKARLEVMRAAVEEQRLKQIIEDLRIRQPGDDRAAAPQN
jgi:hypothetical protein